MFCAAAFVCDETETLLIASARMLELGIENEASPTHWMVSLYNSLVIFSNVVHDTTQMSTLVPY